MFWIILAIIVIFGVVYAANSPEVKSKIKMDMNRRSNSKILDNFDEEQNFIDKYSK